MRRKAIYLYKYNHESMLFWHKPFGIFAMVLALIICAGGILQQLAPAIHADEIDDMNTQYAALEKQLQQSIAAYNDAKVRLVNNEELLKGLQKQTDALQAQQELLEKQNSALKAKIAFSDAKIGELNRQVRLTKDEIDYNITQKEYIEANIKTGMEQLMERMRANYTTGSATWLEVLLQAQNMQDYLTRTELFARVAEKDRQLVEDFEAQTEELEKLIKNLAVKQTEFEAKQKEAVAARNTLSEQEKTLNESRAKLLDKQNELNANTETIKTRMAELSENSKVYISQRDRFTQEMAKLDAEIAKAIAERGSKESADSAQNDKGGNSASSSGLIFPLHVGSGGYRLGDKYGPRINPYTHVAGKHNGADVIVGAGTPVYAMAAGTAIIAHFSVSFGWYIMIDHGNGLFTLYAHSSKLLINEGDHVEQNQNIMLVGSTGYSTGPHLHLEVHIQDASGVSHTADPFSGYVPLP
ncbi:MAG: peptidoglycan DD-metalloendopeptidase family protein [Oscillospiraceae bacterium]|nr:peptidoglycan DD-metalloendopeptidase family protein [Oscillospiraceae bacterium]